MKDTASRATSPVDEFLPFGQMFLYGLQHVLVMYAGAVAVPLIIGAAVGLAQQQLVLLISTDLFICGAATFIQAVGIGRWVGCQLPVIQGSTFAALVPMVLVGQQYGLAGISGSVIVAGIFTLLAAPWISRLIRFFPKVVMGSIVTLIGLSIMPVAGEWIGGGSAGAPGFGSPGALLMSAITLFIILNIYTFASGLIKNIAVLLGLIIGTVLWGIFHPLDLSLAKETPWFNIPRLMYFAVPEFHLLPMVMLSMVMVVVMVETMSSIMATGDIVGKPADRLALRKGLSACGLATLVTGLFNLFPFSAFAQNVGLIGLTGVRSRFVVAVSGIILMLMGIISRIAALVVLIPKPVLGGAGVVMFGMVAVSGIRTLGQVNYRNNNNSMVVALTLGLGMMPVLVPTLFNKMPQMAQMFLHSGITIGTVVAILANLTLNGSGASGKKLPPLPAMPPDPLPTRTAAKRVAVRTMRMWLLLRKVQASKRQSE